MLLAWKCKFFCFRLETNRVLVLETLCSFTSSCQYYLFFFIPNLIGMVLLFSFNRNLCVYHNRFLFLYSTCPQCVGVLICGEMLHPCHVHITCLCMCQWKQLLITECWWCVEPESSLLHSRYLQLNELVLEDIIWVDEVNGLHDATCHIEESKVVGIDCEWKPNYEKGSKPNKVIFRLSFARFLFVLPLTSII